MNLKEYKETHPRKKREYPNRSWLRSLTLTGGIWEKGARFNFEDDAYVLIGDNGSGKTRLLDTICCMFHNGVITNYDPKLSTKVSVTIRKEEGEQTYEFEFPPSEEEYLRLALPPVHNIVYFQANRTPNICPENYAGWKPKYPIFWGAKDKLERFISVAKKYLSKGRSLVFEEDSNYVDITIPQGFVYIQDSHGDNVNPDILSCGEQHALYILSRVYLDAPDSNCIVLIDEPERSLDIFKHQTILPDILASGNVGLLIATTHSPFIFDNELDLSTYDIEAFGEYNEQQT